MPIQIDDKYGQFQNFVAGFYNPKPIVDTIYEYEKYGNDGSRHNKLGSKLVNGYEVFSNIVNAAAEVIISLTNCQKVHLHTHTKYKFQRSKIF